MNRLVIVGNGYDLALNLKTSYQDFIDWYFNKIFKILGDPNKNQYEDGIWKLNHPGKLPFGFKKDDLNQVYKSLLSGLKVKSEANKPILLGRIINDLHKGWVDIEQSYFDALCEVSGLPKYFPEKSPNIKKVSKLNTELKTTTELLLEYLNDLNYPKDENFPIDWHNLKKEFNPNELNRKPKHVPPLKKIERLLLLNFNYTPTLKPLVETLKEQHVNVEIIYIHGEISSKRQPIIFGYGDETIGTYEKLQNLNENECLKNIKSFKYLESDNYQRLMNFVDENYFDILILGHSCGQSDRVLLKNIFEHPKCLCIKPFIYTKEDKSDNYFDTTASISRNFSSNQIMREKVSQKGFCYKFNQVLL